MSSVRGGLINVKPFIPVPLEGKLLAHIEAVLISQIHPDKIHWITYHGSKRQEVWRDIDLYDIVLTTYDTLRSGRAKGLPLFERQWARIVIDEGNYQLQP